MTFLGFTGIIIYDPFRLYTKAGVCTLLGYHHALLGAAGGAVAGSIVEAPIGTRAFMIGIGAFGGLLSDADTESSILGKLLPKWWHKLTPGHRRFTHSLFYVGLMFALAYAMQYVGVDLAHIWKDPNLPYGPIALAAGVVAHLFADMLTEMGVPLFYPLWKKRIRLPKMLRMTTGTDAEDRAVFAIMLLVVAYVLLPLGLMLFGGVHTPLIMGHSTKPAIVFALLALVAWIVQKTYVIMRPKGKGGRNKKKSKPSKRKK